MSTASVDLSKARTRMALRARAMRDVAYRPLEQIADDAAALAQATEAWKDKTGKTRNSIRAVGGPGSNSSSVIARGAAVFLEAGTGKYGPLGHAYVINAKPGGMLHFRIGGRWVSAKRVVHPGIKATHFMRDAAEDMRPRFIDMCVRAVQAAVAR
jgi:hypothetical protein